MRFSRRLKSSPHCLPSPDGRLIATLFPSVVNVRLVETFEVINVIALPVDLAGPVLAFEWSPSSTRVLVAVADQVHVFAALPGERHHAAVRNPMPPAARPTFIGFGSSDADLCMCSSFGLKLALYDLVVPTSTTTAATRAVEISNPKFFAPATACRGFSFRPGTRHLALLTRAAGRDMISIHHPVTREVQRSWAPDATDAQGLRWSPDGRWLVVWESPSQGHRVLFFTPDGNPFRTWTGPREEAAAAAATVTVTITTAAAASAATTRDGGADPTLGAGVKLVEFSSDGRRLAIGDSSRRVCMFDLTSVSEAMRLHHPATVVPRDATTQVWQEQVTRSLSGAFVHAFVRATQAIYPPGRAPSEKPEAGRPSATGCAFAAFDSSSALLATRLEDSPSTLWIWDLAASELRAVLIFHADIASASWHPDVPETLLVSCAGAQHHGSAFVWDPISEGPRPVDFGQQCPGSKATGKTRCRWLRTQDQSPTVFYSDDQDCLLASLGGDAEDQPPRWLDVDQQRREESPLELVPAAAAASFHHQGNAAADDDSEYDMDDTFHYKRENGSGQPLVESC